MCIFVQRATQNGQPIIVFKQTNKQTKTTLNPGGQDGAGSKKSFFY